MKIKIILSLLSTTSCLFGMQQDDDDLVKKKLYSLFDVPRHYDAARAFAKKYNPKIFLTRYSSNEEINKSYRGLSLKLHSDKHQDEKEKYDALFQELEKVYESLRHPHKKEEYDALLRFIDLYSIGIKAAPVGISLYFCWLAYKWVKNNFGASPKATLNQLHNFTHSTIETLLAVRFDRYVHTKKDFSLLLRVDTRHLCTKLSDELSEKLVTTLAHVDEAIAGAYQIIAWECYDCQSIEEMKTRVPHVVQGLHSCQEQMDTVIDECKKELGIESFYTSCKRMAKPVLGVVGLIGLGACWMRYKQSQVKIFGGYIRPAPNFRI